jgi:hypothetical protein
MFGDDIADLDLLKPVYVPMPDTIRDLLASGSTLTEDVLREPLTFRLFRSQNAQLINFFVVHIDQLLQITFDESQDSELSSRAFAILEYSHPTVTSALLANQKLNRTACSIIGMSNKSLYLNRLGSLTLVALYSESAVFIESCGYILQLIDELQEIGVLSLFETMCSPDEGFDTVQSWLVNIGFPQAILKIIDDYPSQRDATRLDRGGIVLSSLYRIITLCGSSPILGPKFCTVAFVTVLNRTVGECADFIEFQRWEAFSALYCQVTHEGMRGLFPYAVELLRDSHSATARSGVAAVDLLGVMMRIDGSVLVPYMVDLEVAPLVLRLLFQHAQHTIFRQTALGFFDGVCRIESIRRGVIQEIFRLVSVNIASKNAVERATAFELFQVVERVARTDQKAAAKFKKVKAFGQLAKGSITQYRERIEDSYGGPLKLAPEDNVEALADRAISHGGF